MVAVPAATPHTVPVAEPAVATDVLLLLQVPPATASLRVVQEPAHMVSVPSMVEGVGVTVTTAVV